MLVDPWGAVMQQQSEGAGVVCAELSWAQQRDCRIQLPALDHRVLSSL